MFGIGGFELFVILLFAFIVFGPDKLPEMARTAGAALAKFRKAQEEMNEVIHSEVLIDPEKEKAPAKDVSVVSRSSAAANKPAPKHTAESFAERKARHDKERAELQRAEEVAANRAAMRKQAADAAEEEAGGGQAEQATEPEQPKPTMSAAELYGTAPVKPKAAAAVAEEAAAAGQAPAEEAPAEQGGE